MVELKDINWLHVVLLGGTPLIALYGLFTTPFVSATMWWTFFYYFFTGLGITAGNHRYWAHRAYTASLPLQYFLLFGSAGAFEGSIKWWCRDHRAHHRFTDTDKDPYNAKKGLFYSHLGWMLVRGKKTGKGRVDVSDLENDKLVKWQHDNYLPIALTFAFVVPTVVAGLGWGDWRGGYFYAGVMRLVFVHHATFCVNSLAHYLGEQSYDDRRTPRDHFITAVCTLGEGYHNFHHEFPTDYRNAIKWYQYDPTKWFIYTAYMLGLASKLNEFPMNEILKGQVLMQEKRIAEIKKRLDYGKPVQTLPEMSFADVQREVKDNDKALMVIEGVVYDVSQFMDDHPGGKNFLKASVGRDVTFNFNGGVYAHSNAARNLMAKFRLARLVGEVPESEKAKEE